MRLYKRKRRDDPDVLPPAPASYKQRPSATSTSISVSPSQSGIVHSGVLYVRPPTWTHRPRRRRRVHYVLREDGTFETQSKSLCIHNAEVSINLSRKSITIITTSDNHEPVYTYSGLKDRSGKYRTNRVRGQECLTLYARDISVITKWFQVLSDAAERTLESRYWCNEQFATTLHSTITSVKPRNGGEWTILKTIGRKKNPSTALIFAWIARNISHFAIVPFIDLFETPSHVHVVMAKIDSGSLCSLIRKGGLNMRETRRIFKCLVKAVGYLHTKGLAHWGIRSERVLLENSNAPHRPRLVGFGGAKRFTRGEKLNLLPHFHYMSSGGMTEDAKRLRESAIYDDDEQQNTNGDTQPDAEKTPGIKSVISSTSRNSAEDEQLFSAYSSHYNSKSHFDDNSFSSTSSVSLSCYTPVDPHFSSPEMLSGTAGTYPCECDIWSLGILLFEMIYGHLPFSSTRGWEYVASAVLKYADLPPQQRRRKLFSKVPVIHHPSMEDAQNLIMVLLHPKPEDRIQPSACLQHPFLVRDATNGNAVDISTENVVGKKENLNEATLGRTQSAHARTGGEGAVISGKEAQVRRCATIRD